MNLIKQAGQLGIVGGAVGIGMYISSHFLRAPYEVYEVRGARVIRDLDGTHYINENPEDMLRYLRDTNREELQEAYENVFGRKP